MSCKHLALGAHFSRAIRGATALMAIHAGVAFAEAPEQVVMPQPAEPKKAVVIEVQPLTPPAQRTGGGVYKTRNVDERAARQSSMAPRGMSNANAWSAGPMSESVKRCPRGLVPDAKGRCH